LCLKNDTDVAHYNFDADRPILIMFGRDVAEGVYAIERWFVVPPFLTNVSALPFQSCCIPCLKNETARREI